MSRREVKIRRRGIDWLKDQYRSGVAYHGVEEVRSALVDGFGMNPWYLPRSRAAAWDRQARREVLSEIFVTQPRFQTSYLRSSIADAETATLSQAHAHHELLTRLETQHAYAAARAARSDAAAVDYQNAERLNIMLGIARQLVPS
jgi:hypothetical protein